MKKKKRAVSLNLRNVKYTFTSVMDAFKTLDCLLYELK